MQPDYPDISNILEAKQQRRFTLAALSWEEKVVIIEQMQRLLPRGQWQSRVIKEHGPVYEVEAQPTTATEDQPSTDPAPRTLIEAQGPPVSQTIIEERR